MKIQLEFNGKKYEADLSKPLDISIPLRPGEENVNCFHAPPMNISPVVSGSFIGSTQEGGPLNFLNVQLNPHGNGTHTECVGHIAKESYTINQCLEKFWFIAELMSITPSEKNGDRIITTEQIKKAYSEKNVEAIIIRTLPNPETKLKFNYSGSNPPYMEAEAVQYLVSSNCHHLLIDLPSVDREVDGGKLSAHKAFWNYPEQPETHRTITELIYVPDSIKDGVYLLNLQIAPFEIDVSPSKPILYKIFE